MKAAEFLGRKAEFEHGFRRSLAYTVVLVAVGALVAVIVGLAGPTGRWPWLPRFLRDGLPFWILAWTALGPAIVLGGYQRRLRRSGLTCPHCGAGLAWARGEIALETTACPACRERVLEDGRRPDIEWEWLQPLRVSLLHRPRWPARAPRPALRQRLLLYRRRTQWLVTQCALAAVVYLGLVSSAERWMPPLIDGARHLPARGESAWGSTTPPSTQLLLAGAAVLLGPWLVGPWMVLRRRHRILTGLNLRCPHCGSSLPARAGLAIALGRCGSCGGAVE